MLESAHARGLAAKEVGMASYAEQVGERLRNIRLQKGLSLHDVEERSSKEFKASVLGAYERGERSISVPRLQRLAIFYGVPVDHLLPRLGPEAATEAAAAGNSESASTWRPWRPGASPRPGPSTATCRSSRPSGATSTARSSPSAVTTCGC
jgi:transcriptional regulator with XRE-family HTH domain